MKTLCKSLLRWVAIAPFSVGIALTNGVAARADDLALSFDLSPRSPKPIVEQAPAVASALPVDTAPPQVKPLEIPTQATAIPVGVSDQPTNTLPPPPQPVSVTPPQIEVISTESPIKPAELSFDIPAVAPAPQASPSTELAASSGNFTPNSALSSTPTPPTQEQDIEARLFEGGSDSLVARAVGSAEGTRNPDGHRNPAYYGHVDPGNGVWNLGSFSYQHGASSPEEADAKQLARLRQQAQVLQQKAIARNLELTLEERLNGIDLANQAPRAALSRGGYIDWLEQAHEMGMRGSDAVLWARTRSFLDPDTSKWDAPGLGNNLHRISSDQERRLLAIARAIEADRLRPQPVQMPPTQPEVAASQPPQEIAEEEAIARLFAQEVPPTFAPTSTPDSAQPDPEVATTTLDDATSPSTVDAILDLDLPEEAELDSGS
ncbi:hypothetical protein H6F93_16565 [Leptolyngbya sp. FACHB-671]|uniref:hypothetical protein n=1 Tax=Leptolyngbya sp. FACHB-671 TaxID=2692812 RepID=UPI0016878A5B|nr:hypothetical protein [Leptolyngbya sp. FACHB-671]MBD2069108.1 hypothetical protein [Leptolyngbya sp. FACHB-671]